ncbi:hypothetical protein BDK51DRAFT_26432 [Blyttiomyces helicus]|uniref:Uncharacterized protein n=1 Tax=Blyttiomyces helicus TaxID=388810 RepID=A0A4P9WFT4_9FUNG|nr:hypothetical protein BDK51DRAFT_26432 [Blyttiomyces helicus]|eukprot:RKO90735.1 hypothetical protein BDK51DRAFT_26432 [Blyttiomyces helicus]
MEINRLTYWPKHQCKLDLQDFMGLAVFFKCCISHFTLITLLLTKVMDSCLRPWVQTRRPDMFGYQQVGAFTSNETLTWLQKQPLPSEKRPWWIPTLEGCNFILVYISRPANIVTDLLSRKIDPSPGYVRSNGRVHPTNDEDDNNCGPDTLDEPLDI